LNKQISVSLDSGFIENAKETASGQGLSLSEFLSRAIYLACRWQVDFTVEKNAFAEEDACDT